MAHRVVFSPEAREDLRSIYDYVATQSGTDRAIAYVRRIIDYCRGFADFPESGTRRYDLLESLRVIGFERRVTIAFHVESAAVTFDLILYGGQELTSVAGSRLPKPTDV